MKQKKKLERGDELIKENVARVISLKVDTTGEKDFEEFFTDSEDLDMEKLINRIIKNDSSIR